jgi:hypothetical protein
MFLVYVSNPKGAPPLLLAGPADFIRFQERRQITHCDKKIHLKNIDHFGFVLPKLQSIVVVFGNCNTKL